MSTYFYLHPFNSKKFEELQKQDKDFAHNIGECTDYSYQVENALEYENLLITPEGEKINLATLLANTLVSENSNNSPKENFSNYDKCVDILDKIGSNEETNNLDFGITEPYIGYITYEETLFLIDFLEKYEFQDDLAEEYKNFLLNTLKIFSKIGKGAIVSCF